MTAFFRVLVTVITMISFMSCQSPRFMYAPASNTVPPITEKGDANAGISYGTNFGGRDDVGYSRSNGLDAYAAYALTPKIAVMSKYFMRSDITSVGDPDIYDDNNRIKYNRSSFEISVGYYKMFGAKKYGLFQCFGGAGFGNNKMNDRRTELGIQYNQFHQASVRKYFIQPAIGYLDKEGVTAAFSIRGSFISFSNIKTDYDADQLEKFRLNTVPTVRAFFIEPAFHLGYRFPKFSWLQLEMQYGFSSSANADANTIDRRKGNASIGATIDLVHFLK